ncbi:MAG: FHA domain-containing protein, partial [Bacteroidetes bacterium]|nr:FHA domain-containing protein [Bacteroidota bacterium]
AQSIKEPTYAGESRTIIISWHSATAKTEMSAGTLIQPCPQSANWGSMANDIGFGLFLTALILLILSELFPLGRKIFFRQKYVETYEKWFFRNKDRLLQGNSGLIANFQLTDPITERPFKAKDLIVSKCEHVISLNSWNRYGNCEAYPETCSQGVYPFGFKKFFAQEGIFLPLNWLWFGCAGGMLGWLVQALIKMEFSTGEGVLGLGFGFGLGLLLSWVEELGQTRKISWWRILLRTLLAALAGFIIFSIGEWLKDVALKNQIGGTLLTWLLFGPALGYILSIQSSIPPVRGILGGLASAIFGFAVYILLFQGIGNEAETALMLSFIASGGLLGVIIVSVVKSLEDFELEYLSPPAYRRVNPISKWLKAGIEIMIGTNPKQCEVLVKWALQDKYVEDLHARLAYRNGNVYLEPLAETLINGEIASPKKSHILKNGDIIQLGRGSITKMLFREKPKGQAKSEKGKKGVK